MPDFVRVRDKSTRHQFDVPAAHPQIGKGLELINDQKRWPDLTGLHAAPRPPLHYTEKGQAATATAPKTKDA
jgi:hypothetical protein